MKNLLLRVSVSFVVVLALRAPNLPAAHVNDDAMAYSYVVVVSRAANEDTDWPKVVDALTRKHKVQYNQRVT